MDTRPYSRRVAAPRRDRPPHHAVTPSDSAPPGHPQQWSPERVCISYYPYVRSLALSLVGNDADAEDVAQEVLLRVVRKLQTFRGEAALTTWLHRVTVNVALLLQRQQRHARQHFGARHGESEADQEVFACGRTAAPEHVALRNELRQSLEKAIAQLPPKYRAVYLAAEVEGLPTAQACDRFGLTLPALKSRLLRSRMMLRGFLTSFGHAPNG